jgi:hypothetical protein
MKGHQANVYHDESEEEEDRLPEKARAGSAAGVGAGLGGGGPSNPRPIIPSLKSEILSDMSRTFLPCPPNSREPIPFETEFFKGHALLLIRTSPVDPQFQSFFNGK